MPEDPSDHSLPKLKLKSASSNSASPDEAQAMDRPADEAPKRDLGMKLRSAGNEDGLTSSTPEPELDAADSGPSFDPNNPFKKKAVEDAQSPEPSASPAIDAPRPAAQPAATKSEPVAQAPSRPVEPELPEPKGGSGIMLSLFMILALVVVLGGGGYAIWMVLNEGPSETTQQESAGSTSEETGSDKSEAKMNPIEKAKAAIAKIPFLQSEEVVNDGEPNGDAKEAPKPKKESKPVQPAKPIETNAPAAPTVIDGDIKSAVSSFLADVHIGGVRSGTDARIMLNGDSYAIGDQVDATTGLKFIGIQDGKLLFRDKNGIVYAKSF